MLRQKYCIVTVRDKRSVMDLFTCMSGPFHFFLGGGGEVGRFWRSLQEFFSRLVNKEDIFSTRKVLLDVELIGYESFFLL